MGLVTNGAGDREAEGENNPRSSELRRMGRQGLALPDRRTLGEMNSFPACCIDRHRETDTHWDR